MSIILPPAEWLWWKHPLDRVEGTWIGDCTGGGVDHVLP